MILPLKPVTKKKQKHKTKGFFFPFWVLLSCSLCYKLQMKSILNLWVSVQYRPFRGWMTHSIWWLEDKSHRWTTVFIFQHHLKVVRIFLLRRKCSLSFFFPSTNCSFLKDTGWYTHLKLSKAPLVLFQIFWHCDANKQAFLWFRWKKTPFIAEKW